MAARPPSTRVEVGTVRVAPEAAVRPRPAAVVKLAAVIGSRRKIGCEVAMDTRQMATVKAIKPCKCAPSAKLQNIEWKSKKYFLLKSFALLVGFNG